MMGFLLKRERRSVTWDLEQERVLYPFLEVC